jgi:hypothetical protein
VFVTNLQEPLDRLVAFYNQRAGAENLIKLRPGKLLELIV